jgi:hypothetical protein
MGVPRVLAVPRDFREDGLWIFRLPKAKSLLPACRTLRVPLGQLGL